MFHFFSTARKEIYHLELALGATSCNPTPFTLSISQCHTLFYSGVQQSDLDVEDTLKLERDFKVYDL